VNDLPQNQASQGHGYLGVLKTLTPELVQEVTILDGPFSAGYGDFSGLGVVQIRTRERLPEQLTARIQAGSFDTFRSFVGYSPELSNAAAFIAYEGSYTIHRFSFSSDLFLIDRSNEQVYVPDDGTFELKGPSRSYGYEGKTSLQLLRHISLEGGTTQVMNSLLPRHVTRRLR
jgi:outer membrane cobalamin receptor